MFNRYDGRLTIVASPGEVPDLRRGLICFTGDIRQGDVFKHVMETYIKMLGEASNG